LPACPPVHVSAAYPNPVFDSQTTIRVNLTSPCPNVVSWKIITVAHRVVAQGQMGVQGTQTLTWDQQDQKGQWVSNGLYYLVVSQTGQPNITVKILILR